MAGRRGWGEDSIYFDHSGECRDPEAHQHCPGRWRGVVSLKPGPGGQRRRKKVSGKNETEVRAKLAELHDELDDGVVTNASYTVAHAIEDWLADGLAGRAPKTVSTQREVLEPLIDIIGAVPLRELSAPTVRSALKDLAATRATRTVGMTHAGLTRAIRHAEANDKVRRNVATFVDAPAGQEGRPSKSLTSGQSVALIQAARPYGLYAYVVLSLLVSVRTEEARALRWDHVDLAGGQRDIACGFSGLDGGIAFGLGGGDALLGLAAGELDLGGVAGGGFREPVVGLAGPFLLGGQPRAHVLGRSPSASVSADRSAAPSTARKSAADCRRPSPQCSIRTASLALAGTAAVLMALVSPPARDISIGVAVFFDAAGWSDILPCSWSVSKICST
jgi:hypothetical protein